MAATSRLTVQSLEDRTVPAYVQPLPAGISLNAAGTLYVIGDAKQQDATVWMEGGQLRATMSTTWWTENSGQPVQMTTFINKTFDPAAVQRITFQGRDNGDTFHNQTALPAYASGGNGDDDLTGGTGNDTLVGGAGNDWLEGGAGDDSLRGTSGNDWYRFNTGPLGTDTIDEDPSEDNDGLDFSGMAAGVTINLGSMAVQPVVPDTLSLKLVSWLGIERVDGSAGADSFTGNIRNNAIDGKAGNDSLWGAAGNDVLTGGTGDDVIRGGSGNDGLNGNAGDDDLYGESGNDNLTGFTGDNFLSDGMGNDRIDFSNNSEGVWFTSAGGNDTIVGSSYTDVLTGTDGNDRIDGGLGNDTLRGMAGNDSITGSNGNDDLTGTDGNDTLDGGSGTDLLEAAAGNDRLTGGPDNDDLLGGFGNDYLAGEQGDDFLGGGNGKDTMDGGSDTDELYADQGNESLKNGEHVEITVPGGSPQTDGWSCGPNSGSRLLRSYGYDVSYSNLRSQAQNSNVISQLGFGTPPPNLRTIMKNYKSNTQLKSGASFSDLLARLGEGRPVVALIGWGEIYVPNPLSPLDLAPEKMHYICLTGFDLADQELYYTDTNGEEKAMSFATFKDRWDWPAGPTTYLWLSAMGIKHNTMIW
jgi:Ca2+-binding RTX toxin-like protein